MKTNIKIKSLFFMLALTGIGITACENFKNIKGVEEVTPVKVSVSATVLHDPDEPLPPKLTVRFTNFKETLISEVEMDASLNVIANGIVPGIYTVTATGMYDDGSRVWMYSGSAVNIAIHGETTNVAVEVKMGRTGPLVFKEIYYAGGQRPTGAAANYGQFFEVYNNSETTYYLDSLCVTRIYPQNATDVLPDWLDPDWEQFVFTADCWQVPGNGTDYPLGPGEAALMVAIGQNYTIEQTNAPTNNSTAEFELYTVSATNPNNDPPVDMICVYGSAKVMMPVFGGAYVMFRQTGPIDRNFTASPADRPTTRYLKIRRKDVIDAVECVDNSGRMTDKRVPFELDAGAATVEGTYNGASVVRKIQSIRPDGTYIFQDTNNSTDDFEWMVPAMIRRYNPKVPSWNTWL